METSARESPLDVLSRAALMLQRNILPPSYDEARSLSDKCKKEHVQREVVSSSTIEDDTCGGKWKKDKRYRNCPFPPIEALSPDYHVSKYVSHGEPLDMSTNHKRRDRGSPPSYIQSILSSSYVSPPILIPTSNKRDEAEGVCDPVIDEHFRRSLGNDYQNVFSRKTQNKCRNQQEVSPSPLSVEEHFAKALGDTWVKLQANEEREKSSVKMTSSSAYPIIRKRINSRKSNKTIKVKVDIT